MASAVYLIFGDEYLVSAKAKETIGKFVPPEEELTGLEVIDGRVETADEALKALGRCLEAVQTAGFFTNQKVVWFRDVAFLSDKGPGKPESVKSRVGDLVAVIKGGLLPGQVLVVTSSDVDKRYAFYKACKAKGEIHEFAVAAKDYVAEKQAMTNARAILARKKIRMDADALAVFLERVGTDTRQLVNEIEKLAVYLGDSKEARLSDVKAVTSVSRGALVWDLADAVGRRETSRALVVLRQLLFQKESAVGLVLGLENRARELAIYREALDRGWLVEKAGYRDRATLQWGPVPPDVEASFSEAFNRDPRDTHPYRVNLLATQAAGFSPAQLREWHKAVMEAHVQMVSTGLPDAMVMEILILRVLAK